MNAKGYEYITRAISLACDATFGEEGDIESHTVSVTPNPNTDDPADRLAENENAFIVTIILDVESRLTTGFLLNALDRAQLLARPGRSMREDVPYLQETLLAKNEVKFRDLNS